MGIQSVGGGSRGAPWWCSEAEMGKIGAWELAAVEAFWERERWIGANKDLVAAAERSRA
jgi:hypothetical protein